MLKIYIDAGHNYDLFGTGATGNGMKEQDITFEVGYLLKEILQKDFEVKLSRPTLESNVGKDSTTSINLRWQEANAFKADYFISIHVNAGGGTGVETFFYKNETERSVRSKEFAVNVNDIYAREMGIRNRGVKQDTQTYVGSLGVLRYTNMPAILIELGFIDSPLVNPDIDMLRNKKKEMAQALAKGIYFHTGVVPKWDVGTVRFSLFGEKIVDIDGYIEDGVTFVKARQFAEELGYVVEWDGANKVAVIRR